MIVMMVLLVMVMMVMINRARIRRQKLDWFCTFDLRIQDGAFH